MVSSAMAAFLYPWQRVLGIDLKYRGGFSFNADDKEGSRAADNMQPRATPVALGLYHKAVDGIIRV
jgi:hypothetical protein